MSYGEISAMCSDASGFGLQIIEEHDGLDLAAAFAKVLCGEGVACVVDASWPESTKARVREQALMWQRNRQPTPSDVALLKSSGNPAIGDGAASSIFMVGLSSGTSGTPKGFTRTRESWASSLRVSIEYFDIRPHDVTLAPGPGASSMNLYALAECLMSGSTFVGLSTFSARAALEALNSNQATRLVVVPTVLDLMVTLAESRGETAHDLRGIVCAGSALGPELARRAQNWAPQAVIHTYYGASELGFVAATVYNEQTAPGLEPFPGVELRVDDSAGVPVLPADIGTIAVRSPYISNGYAWGDDRLAFSPVPGEGSWYTVNDLGFLDGRGKLRVVGRSSDMMQIAGNNVYPQSIERALAPSGANYAVVVTSIPDPIRAQRVVAAIQFSSAGDSADAQHTLGQIRQLATHLPATHRPSEYYLLSAAPLSAAGKLSRTLLQQWIGDNDARAQFL